MGKLVTSVLGAAHSYTRSKTPWRLEAYPKKLFHYLSGGGLRSFGRTVAQEEAELKRVAFLVKAAVVAVIWFWLWI